MARKKVLVTGGRGYIGARLCRFLADDVEFVIFSGTRLPSENSLFDDGINRVTTDWNSIESLVSCCNGMDAIVHLAAINAANSIRDPVAALRVNSLGTALLMRAAIQSGVSRFIYISTAHVYGFPLVGTVTEETLPHPVHPYATSHRAAEDIVCAASFQGSIEGVVLRLSNGFGAPDRVDADCWDLLFNDLCRQAVVSGVIALRSSGKQRRDFIPLLDVCRAIRHCLLSPASSLGSVIFNLGGQWSPTILEAATFVADRFETHGLARPAVFKGAAVTKECCDSLEYRIDLLKATGFTLNTAASEELDGLIDLCVKNFGINRE